MRRPHGLVMASMVLAALSGLVPGMAAAQSAKDVGRAAKDVAVAPLRDTNLVKEAIPPLLLQSSADPYSLTGIRSCAQFARAIGALDKVLGPDVDRLQPKDGKSRGELALDLGEELALGFIPFRGIIRRLSGAEARARKARAAIYAGGLRRAYLKGTARARGCKL